MPRLRVKKLRRRYTHAQLVERAAQWLGGGGRRCGLVVVEYNCYAINEFPDAIGWRPDGHSILVECKVSRGDFHRDKRKRHRLSRKESMGRERYYLAPPGVLVAEDMPEGYGLLEPVGERMKVVVVASTDERPGRAAAEVPLLVNRARRHGWALARQDHRHVRMRRRWKPAGCVVYEEGAASAEAQTA